MCRSFCLQEIINQYPKKKVTIIQSSDRLLNDKYPTKLSDRLQRELEDRGVKVVLGERVEKNVYDAGKGTVTLKDGTSIEGERDRDLFRSPNLS